MNEDLMMQLQSDPRMQAAVGEIVRVIFTPPILLPILGLCLLAALPVGIR